MEIFQIIVQCALHSILYYTAKKTNGDPFQISIEKKINGAEFKFFSFTFNCNSILTHEFQSKWKINGVSNKGTVVKIKSG
jgi:hypothetical protein